MTSKKKSGLFFCELDAKAAENPNFEILTFVSNGASDETLTYGHIVTNGRKLAIKLKESGFGQGDVLAILMRNHPEFIYSLYATNILGAILQPIDPRTKGERLRFILKDSKAKGIIFTSEFQQKILPVLKLLPEIEIIGVACKKGIPPLQALPDLEKIWQDADASGPCPGCTDPDVVMEVIYPSGTGEKKRILKNHQLEPFARIAKTIFQYNRFDKLYTDLSLTRITAQAMTMIPSLFMGIPSVITCSTKRQDIWKVCKRYGCSSFPLVEGRLKELFFEPEKPQDTDNPVRLVLSSGTPQSIWKSFEKRFNVFIHEWHGTMDIGFAHKPPGIGPIGSCGKPLEGIMEMKVVREDHSDCTPFETGQIICRFIGEDFETREKQTMTAWQKTGNHGHQDENGWFFLNNPQKIESV